MWRVRLRRLYICTDWRLTWRCRSAMSTLCSRRTAWLFLRELFKTRLGTFTITVEADMFGYRGRRATARSVVRFGHEQWDPNCGGQDVRVHDPKRCGHNWSGAQAGAPA